MKIDFDFIHYGEITIQSYTIEKIYGVYLKLKRKLKKPSKPVMGISLMEMDEITTSYFPKISDVYFTQNFLLSKLLEKEKP